MTARTSRTASRALPWVLGVALVLGAGAVTAVTPSDDDLLDPFPVPGAIGDTVRSRTLIADVSGVSFADRLLAEDEWEAEGNWLVIDLAVSAPTTEVDAEIGVASLVVDGRVFQASERPVGSLLDADLRVGIDTVGVLAFELPTDLVAGAAELRLTGEYPTPHLDDVIAIPLRLDDAARAGSITVEQPRLGAR